LITPEKRKKFLEYSIQETPLFHGLSPWERLGVLVNGWSEIIGNKDTGEKSHDNGHDL